MRSVLSVVLAVVLAGCAEEDSLGHNEMSPDDDGKADGYSYGDNDIVSTKLALDVRTQEASAEIWTVADGIASFEVGDLEILGVRGENSELPYEHEGDRLRVSVGDGFTKVNIDYRFFHHDQSDGFANAGWTVIWPYYCGNLFPCHSDPADGFTFELALSGVPEGMSAIFPSRIDARAPAYMLGWTLGSYSCRALGNTSSGTTVGVCWLPGGQADALTGTTYQVEVFDWLERTLGAYSFGSEVASVAVRWGEGAYGGMEHHPYWHVAEGAMGDAETHAHEAAHGWYGNGVRIRCWEDFVLSEGTVSYLAARALGQVAGQGIENQVWASYREDLERAVATRDSVAWPTSCGVVDILKDGLYSSIPYKKGAFFFHDLAEAIGSDQLDSILARFYAERVGTSARMEDLLAQIHADSGFDPTPLANAWLRGLGIPD